MLTKTEKTSIHQCNIDYLCPNHNIEHEDNNTMYAVVFDLDTNCLNECYDGNTYHGAYKLVRDYMSANGFNHQQGSVYFGDSTVDAVKCVLVIQQLGKTYPWFATCVKDIRMLRIEDNNDLMPALR